MKTHTDLNYSSKSQSNFNSKLFFCELSNFLELYFKDEENNKK